MFENLRISRGPIKGKCLLTLTLAAFFVACRNNPEQPEQVFFFDSGTPLQDFFPRAEPETVGIDRAALAALVVEARNSHSSALIVVKDGKVLVERYFGAQPKPLRINSVTKSIVSLAIGQLIAAGKIPSLDTPLSRWYPEWNTAPKAQVTLRHVLTHTSGLYHEESAEKLYQQPDVVKYARGLQVVDAPGKRFSYSNEAVALIPGIVLMASGTPLDKYLDDRLFKPLGITEYKWDRDAAGNVMAYGGLCLLPRDLVRIGQLMADSGRWKNKQLVPAAWVRACTRPARADIPDYGLLWWLYPDQNGSSASPAGFGGDGWLGQYLAVYPKQRLVAVRLHTVESGNDVRENRRYGFLSFREKISAMVKPNSADENDRFKVEVH